MMAGCNKDGKIVTYEYSEGDLKLTLTKEYIIVDSCVGFNGFSQAHWIYNKTISRSDTVECKELMTRILERR